MSSASEFEATLHASSVCVGERAVMFVGPSGSGKSSLALELISRGATLVSDDRTIVRKQGEHLAVSAPSEIAGKIEARGLGILDCAQKDSVRLVAVVDLSQDETERLPYSQEFRLLNCGVKLFRSRLNPYLAAPLLILLRAGGRSP